MTNSGKSGDTEAPRALKIVALIFVAGGLFSVLAMLLNLSEGIVRLSFGVVQFWIAAGLLRFNKTWLKWAKRFIWFDLIMIDVISLFMAFDRNDPKFKFGPIALDISNTEALLMFLVMASVSIWSLRVLNRPEIKKLFKEDADPGASFIREASPLRKFGAHVPAQEILDSATSEPLKVEPTTNPNM